MPLNAVGELLTRDRLSSDPLLLIIEDLNWAEPGTLALLRAHAD